MEEQHKIELKLMKDEMENKFNILFNKIDFHKINN